MQIIRIKDIQYSTVSALLIFTHYAGCWNVISMMRGITVFEIFHARNANHTTSELPTLGSSSRTFRWYCVFNEPRQPGHASGPNI